MASTAPKVYEISDAAAAPTIPQTGIRMKFITMLRISALVAMNETKLVWARPLR